MTQYEIFQSEAFPGELVAEQPSGAFESEFGAFGEFEDEASESSRTRRCAAVEARGPAPAAAAGRRVDAWPV